MTALMGAGMFGLVPHPMACLEPYRRDRHESLLFAEDDRPPLRGVRKRLHENRLRNPAASSKVREREEAFNEPRTENCICRPC